MNKFDKNIFPLLIYHTYAISYRLYLAFKPYVTDFDENLPFGSTAGTLAIPLCSRLMTVQWPNRGCLIFSIYFKYIIKCVQSALNNKATQPVNKLGPSTSNRQQSS